MTKDNILEFNKDFHPEFEGWMWEMDDGIWISCIISKEEGKGNFLKLLEELKSKYNWIKIPTPSSRMAMIAFRNGFELKKEWFEEFEEEADVLVWQR